jgi:hypothetical protein
VGAPGFALPDPVAPIAPDPFVPDVSTPVKLITVIEAIVDIDNVAVTLVPVNWLLAKARQISDVPYCVFVRFTSTHDSPPPATLWTVVLIPLLS